MNGWTEPYKFKVAYLVNLCINWTQNKCHYNHMRRCCLYYDFIWPCTCLIGRLLQALLRLSVLYWHPPFPYVFRHCNMNYAYYGNDSQIYFAPTSDVPRQPLFCQQALPKYKCIWQQPVFKLKQKCWKLTSLIYQNCFLALPGFLLAATRHPSPMQLETFWSQVNIFIHNSC